MQYTQAINKDKPQLQNQLYSQNEQQMDKNILPPANPIINRNKQGDKQQIIFRLLDPLLQNNKKSFYYQTRKQNYELKNKSNGINLLQSQQRQEIEYLNLNNGYDKQNLIFRKFNNKNVNVLNHKRYYASIFTNMNKAYQKRNNSSQINLPSYQGMVTQQKLAERRTFGQSLINSVQDQLQFSSNFQSGNLFAVYKTGHLTYDLILQNDLNTTGYNQWFYFSVKNKNNKNILAKFNIVNMYKSSSLYNKGMKPMVCSLDYLKNSPIKCTNRQISQKEKWERKGQKIFYQKNQLKRQSSNKFYYSLSFCYDFTKQNDIVQFAHTIPYTYTKLLELLKQIEKSPKCIIKSIGITPLKKSIPIIKFQSNNNKIQKKAILIMARQHPGQVQSSFVVEDLLLNLIKSTAENDFLLFKYNIYVIPMVNVDGVILGNYRSNAMGYDLNRNWQGQQKQKYPQIVMIKKQIKKIMAKNAIQLILDLHGHSQKMNTFFYGNSFGPDPYIFPFIASKTNQFVKFEDCTFSLETKQKAKTARNVLGNLIKQTGNVYTYQISFYGGTKKGKVVNFYEQQYRQLGRDLLSSMHKVFFQAYKQQKTLKEGLFFKQIRKQLKFVQNDNRFMNQQNSDSQIDSQRQVLQQQKQKQIKEKTKQMELKMKNPNISLTSSSIDIYQQNLQNSNTKNEKFGFSTNVINSSIKKQINLYQKKADFNTFNYDETLQEKIRKHKQYAQRLKVFGQNYLIKANKSQVHTSRNYETFDQQDKYKRKKNNSTFENRPKQSLSGNFAYLSSSKRIKQKHIKNFSTLNSNCDNYNSGSSSINSMSLQCKAQFKNEANTFINDMVKVRKIQYRKPEKKKSKKDLISQSMKIDFSLQDNNLSNDNNISIKRNQNILKLPVILAHNNNPNIFKRLSLIQ